LIDNALVGDPNLKQVVSHTFEVGLRGTFNPGKGILSWSIDYYHALNTELRPDIAFLEPNLLMTQSGHRRPILLSCTTRDAP